MEHAFLVQQTIEIENENFFFPRSIQLNLLKNYPHLIHVIAQWMYQEWHPYDASLTKEKLIHSFKMRSTENSIPITFIVLRNDLPIAVISLKQETAPEFADFPQKAIWMGSLQVVPKERNQGIGEELLKFSQMTAKQFGYEKLFFYTSNPVNVKWYLKRGAHIIKEQSFRHHLITIMAIP